MSSPRPFADVRFRCMGTDCRVLVDAPDPAIAAHRARHLLTDADLRLSRFRPESDLSALNAAATPVVAVSPALAAHVEAARWAAERSGGLVDASLAAELEAAGYGPGGIDPVPITRLLPGAPPRRAARPGPAARWAAVRVTGRLVARPVGLRLDLGGTAKGLAADHALAALGRVRSGVVDCGGDLAIGGASGRPVPVVIRHPITGEHLAELRVARGGVATSGIARRAWRGPAGVPAHHLLDPSTGAPAWTGVLAATAVAPSALEAEVLAKTAVLSGPRAARELLAAHGGLVVRENGVDHVPAAADLAA